SSAGPPPRPTRNRRPPRNLCYDRDPMNICVVGTGYVGLVTGAVFADLGNDVVCVDNVAEKIATLQAGGMPIYEPGLEEMVARNVADGRLGFTTDLTDAVRRSVVVFITVGTPATDTGQTDLGAVEAVAREIGRAMERYTVVVNKSTVPVGTGDLVREVIERHQSRPVPFDVVSNPEFLREGCAIEDTLRPDRIVIGAPTQQVAMSLLELYAPLERPMIIVDVPSAEIIKYASNAFLSTKISFMNAIANICELAGADVTQVMKGMGLDARIGSAFLSAGLGFGGSCFPKDTDSPVAAANARRLLPAAVDYRDSPYDAATGADAVAVVTEWNEFKFLNLERLRAVMRRPLVFDGRNVWEPERMRRLGFEYHSIGRKPILPPS